MTNYINGGPGNDTLIGNNKFGFGIFQDGKDVIHGNDGNDFIRGKGANDLLYGDDGRDRIYGDGGNDKLYGGRGNDKLYGGKGNDHLEGNRGNDFLNGESGHDSLYGGSGRDTMYGGSGNDKLWGGSGNDWMSGGSGNDVLKGQSGNDTLVGSKGHDTLIGGTGNDYMVGSDFPNQGRGERDVLISGNYNDTDTFVLGERSGGVGRVFYNDRGNRDYAVIQDFDVYDFAGDVADRIQLLGSSSAYSLRNGSWNGVDGVGIYFGGDVIGVVQGFTASQLNLNSTRQFTYV